MHSMIFLHLHIDFLPMLVLDGVRVEIRQVVMGRLTAPDISCERVGMRQANSQRAIVRRYVYPKEYLHYHILGIGYARTCDGMSASHKPGTSCRSGPSSHEVIVHECEPNSN
jgi:hypothetical protein